MSDSLKYFISYNFVKNGQQGYGNIDVQLSGAISDSDDIHELEKGISKEMDAENVVINNFILLNR